MAPIDVDSDCCSADNHCVDRAFVFSVWYNDYSFNFHHLLAAAVYYCCCFGSVSYRLLSYRSCFAGRWFIQKPLY